MAIIRNNNTLVGRGLFQASDFYYKGRQSPPIAHNIPDGVIAAFEFINDLFAPRYGLDAKPYFTSTLRLPSDSNYETKNGRLSTHSQELAADGNWSNGLSSPTQHIEDEIILIIGHDISVKGFIYDELRQLGVNGIGTYYRDGGSNTFLHLDGRQKFTYFKQLRYEHRKKAAALHRSFMAELSALTVAPMPIIPTAPTSTPIPVTRVDPVSKEVIIVARIDTLTGAPIAASTATPIIEPSFIESVVASTKDAGNDVLLAFTETDGGEDPIATAVQSQRRNLKYVVIGLVAVGLFFGLSRLIVSAGLLPDK